jgi:membrane-associated phospholipid phosphatase
VPAAGLDPTGIHLVVDRRAIRPSSSSALRASDWTVTGAVAFPIFLGLSADRNGGNGAWLSGAGRRLALYAEASLFTDALTVLLKRSVARPRPTLYRLQGEAERRADAWSLSSFPSGHATRAGCAAAIGTTDFLRTRPYARWTSHFLAGAVGGMLAATTAALRVEGGVHFPSDAAGGLLLGTAGGTGVSLLHRYETPSGAVARPPRSAWIAAACGMLSGGLLAATLASQLGPS